MAAEPVRKISKTRKRKRRTHFKLQAPHLVQCPNCQELILSHRLCKHCGYYDGKKVL